MKKWNSQANETDKRLVLHKGIRCDLLLITKQCYFRPNEFNVRSVLHRRVSLAAVINMSFLRFKRLQKSKDSL